MKQSHHHRQGYPPHRTYEAFSKSKREGAIYRVSRLLWCSEDNRLRITIEIICDSSRLVFVLLKPWRGVCVEAVNGEDAKRVFLARPVRASHHK